MEDGPPSPGHLLGELRFLAEWRAGRNQYRKIEGRDQARGKTVLVIPGFLASDWMTGPLRRALTAAGYDAHGWALGRNLGLRPGVIEGLTARVAELARLGGGPIILVGWSLGGLYAREIAKMMPEDVGRVVTLGSPFSGDIRANRVWRLYERVAGHSVDRPPLSVRLSEKPSQPTYALWSRRDGIVSPAASRGLTGEADMVVEVDCSHLGFIASPAAIDAVLSVLA